MTKQEFIDRINRLRRDCHLEPMPEGDINQVIDWLARQGNLVVRGNYIEDGPRGCPFLTGK